MRRKGNAAFRRKYRTDTERYRRSAVICSFPDDIYALAAMLVKQDDIKLIEKRIISPIPKPNGYRSLHLIVEVPIFPSNCKKYMRVEVQFRTIAMDSGQAWSISWKYKKEIDHSEEIAQELEACAEIISSMDEKDAGDTQPD